MAPAKVYGPAMSTNVMRILVCLEEVGAEYEVVPVDMSTGEHKRPPHISRNVSTNVARARLLLLLCNRSLITGVAKLHTMVA